MVLVHQYSHHQFPLGILLNFNRPLSHQHLFSTDCEKKGGGAHGGFIEYHVSVGPQFRESRAS